MIEIWLTKHIFSRANVAEADASGEGEASAGEELLKKARETNEPKGFRRRGPSKVQSAECRVKNGTGTAAEKIIMWGRLSSAVWNAECKMEKSVFARGNYKVTLPGFSVVADELTVMWFGLERATTRRSGRSQDECPSAQIRFV